MNKLTRALSLCVALSSYAAAAIAPAVMVTIDGYVSTDPYPLKIASMPIAGVTAVLQPQLAYITNTQAAALLPDSSTTDAAGHFAFRPIVAGGYTISLGHAGYASRNMDVYATKDTTIRLSLLASGAHGAVRGKVTEACNPILARPCLLTPVPKCTVTVSVLSFSYILNTQSAAVYPPWSPAIFTAITNDSGNYTIDSIPISSNNFQVIVTAAKNGFVAQSADTGLWNMATTVMNFALAASQGATVTTTPASPTSQDSITYHFYDNAMCCGTQFVNPSVSVSDTQIFLNFSANTAPCAYIDCFVAGAGYDFKGGKLKAGKYAIYKAETYYCTTNVCPQIVIMPVRIGQVIVTSTGVVDPKQPFVSSADGFTLWQTGKTIHLDCSPARTSRISVFDARGKTVGILFNGQSRAGKRSFSWTAPAPGAYFVTMESSGAAAYSRKIIVSR
jgi:hypothetical protein